ncbi:MAG: fibronectin type III domain-containing protein, partial [Marinilabiliaceae bacterium]
MRRIFYILCLFILTFSEGQSQVHHPVRTYTTVNPPAPWSLDGFVSTPGKLNLQVFVDDISLEEHPVKLRLSIKGNGVHIYTRPDYTSQPIYLEGGGTKTFTGDDLSGLFDPQHLIFEGYSKNRYRRSGRLPEGVYRISFDVVDYHRDVVISRAFPGVVKMNLEKAPRLLTPQKSEEIDPSMMSSLRFSWVMQGISNPLADVFYRFKLWEIRPDGRSAREIVRSTRPLYTTETGQSSLIYDASLPALEPGREYAWQVEAIDRAGEVLFKNDGKSEVSTFRYGQQCPVPSPYITGVTTNSASLRWNYDPSVNSYRVLLRQEGRDQWEEKTTSSSTYTLENLSGFTRYEIKVLSSCGDSESDESEILKFSTDRDVEYACGNGAGNFDLSNRDPLPELRRFDTFKASDFIVEVDYAEKESGGRFSGTGLLMVPYLNFVKFKVNFDNILINTDYRMTDGEVVFVYDEENGMVLGEDDFTQDPSQTPEHRDVDADEALSEGTDHQETVEGEVEDISIDDNTVTITTTDGEKKTVQADEDETVGVNPSDDDKGYVADTGTGRVYSFPKQSSGAPGEVRSSAQSGVYGGKISFR